MIDIGCKRGYPPIPLYVPMQYIIISSIERTTAVSPARRSNRKQREQAITATESCHSSAPRTSLFSAASSCVHLVSDPANRLNDLRLGRVVLDLLTQTLDVYRQRIVVYIGAGNIPH